MMLPIRCSYFLLTLTFTTTALGDLGPAAAPMVPDSSASLQQEDIPALMRQAKNLLKELDETIKKKDMREQSMEKIGDLLQVFLQARRIVPPLATSKTDKKRGKFIANYRKMQIDVCKMILGMEALVVDGKLASAKKVIGKIRAMKGKGHGKYKAGR